MGRSTLAALLTSAALLAAGCLPASSPRVVTPPPLVGDALYRSSGAVPAADQLAAMLRDTVVRFRQAAEMGDFTPFVRWKARRAQSLEPPDALAATARRLASEHVDLAAFHDVAPTYLQPPRIVVDPTLGPTLQASAAYAGEGGRLLVDVSWLEQQGQWKAARLHLDFAR